MSSSVLIIFLSFSSLFQQQVQKVREFRPIFDGAAAYCEKVKNIALYYVAKEEIEAVAYPVDTSTLGGGKSLPTVAGSPGGFSAMSSAPRMLTVEPSRSNYTYDYQLVQKEGQFEEKRTLLEENGVDKHEKDARLKNIPFVSKCLIFGPVGFISRYWQGYFHYSVLGEETVHGRACVIVKAVPKKPMMENNNRARIWLDKENQSVLRIEWEPESFGYEEKTVARASNLKRLTVVCRVDFDVEKNGVRFPSRQVFREVARGSKKGDETILSEVKYKYSNYKFFTVGVDVKY